MTDLRGPAVRVLLVGTATQHGPTLPSLPQVARSLEALRSAFLDVCGVRPGNVRVLLDPPDPMTMAQAVTEESRAAQGVLVVYFLGHGLLGPNGELHLAASSTDELIPGLSAHQALPFSLVREALTGCRAASVVMILDCCFSGRARLPPAVSADSFDLPAAAAGTYLLASAQQMALALPDEEYTRFTAAALQVLTQGDPLGPPVITLDALHDAVFRALRDQGGPLPMRRAAGRGGDLALTPNRALPTAAAEPAQPPAPGRSPYLGLSSFEEEDAPLFRGRERLTNELISIAQDAWKDRSPLVVVGASGSGKSSLLRAGLLHQLRLGNVPSLPGAAAWPAVVLTPGSRPGAAMDTRLPQRREQGLVVLVDQLEELFTLGATRQEQADFVRRLRALADPPDGAVPALVVLALRADAYGGAAGHPDLLPGLRDHQLLISQMRPEEVRAAIEEPAAVAGLHLDDGLAELILHELGVREGTAEPGVLPLLSHTLWATWLHRSGDRLTMAAYRATGGVAHAIATTADATYQALDEPEQAAVRWLLPRLVRVQDDAEDTTHPQPLSDLQQGPVNPGAAAHALEQLTAARLVTLDRDVMRITHEALLRSWPRLRAWVEADRAWLRTYRQVEEDGQAWARAGHDRSHLYRGSRLVEVRRQVGQDDPGHVLGQEATRFVAASWRQERRTTRVRTAVICVLAVLLVATSGGVLATATLQRRTVRQRDVVLAQLLVARAAQVRDDNPGLGSQLALAAYRLDPAIGAPAVLTSQGQPGIYDLGDPVLDVAQQADGSVIAISTPSAIRLWSPAGHELSTLGGLTGGPVAISSQRHLLLAATGPVAALYGLDHPPTTHDLVRGDLTVWDLADPRRPRPLAKVAGTRKILALALSPDERLVAIGAADGWLRLWRLDEPRPPRQVSSVRVGSAGLTSLAFSRAGDKLAAAGADHAVTLWDVRAPRPVLLSRPQRPGGKDTRADDNPSVRHTVAFDPSGRRLVTFLLGSYSDSVMMVYAVDDPRRPRALTTPDAAGLYCEDDISVDVDPQEPTLLVTTCDNGVKIYEYQESRPSDRRLRSVGTLATSSLSWIGPAVFRQTRPGILAAGSNGLRLWGSGPANRPGARLSATAYGGFTGGQLAFGGRHGRVLLADTGDLTAVRLWDLTNPDHVPDATVYQPFHPEATGWEIASMSGAVALDGDGTLLAMSEVDGHRPAVALQRTAAHAGRPAGRITTLDNGAIDVWLGPRHLLAVVDNAEHRPDLRAAPSVRLYDVHDPAAPAQLAKLLAEAYTTAISPNGALLLAGTAHEVRSWDIRNPRHPKAYPPVRISLDSSVVDVSFSSDGRLVTAGDGHRTYLLQVEKNRLLPAMVLLRQTNMSVSTGSFSPDGHTVALMVSQLGVDGVDLELLDISAPLSPTLEGRWRALAEGPLLGAKVAFSPEGRTVAVLSTASLDLWDTDPARAARRLCSSVGDVITPAQWQQYAPQLSYRPPCP